MSSIEKSIAISDQYVGLIFMIEATYFMMVSCFASSQTLKMEEVYYSETSVHFQRTSWHFISEDKCRFESFRSYVLVHPTTETRSVSEMLRLKELETTNGVQSNSHVEG
jgi:hypothetical protein